MLIYCDNNFSNVFPSFIAISGDLRVPTHIFRLGFLLSDKISSLLSYLKKKHGQIEKKDLQIMLNKIVFFLQCNGSWKIL